MISKWFSCHQLVHHYFHLAITSAQQQQQGFIFAFICHVSVSVCVCLCEAMHVLNLMIYNVSIKNIYLYRWLVSNIKILSFYDQFLWLLSLQGFFFFGSSCLVLNIESELN